MQTYISLLRGINVSGQKKINMKELKLLYEEAGLKNVQTYIQSGNVIFQATTKNTTTLAAQIQTFIKKHYSFEVEVVVLTLNELKNIAKSNPFQKEKSFEEGKMYVCFLKEDPKKELIEAVKGVTYESDRFIIDNNTIYLFVPGGYGNTKLNNNFFESKLKVAATTRNWNTVNKLISIGETM